MSIDSTAVDMWAEMKAGSPDRAWFVMSMTEDKKGLEVTAAGRCGPSHIARFLDENQIQFGGFRYFALAPGNRQCKVVLFTFRGPKAGLKFKAAAGNLAGPFSKALDGASLEMDFSSLEDVNEEAVQARIAASSKASFRPTGYEFGTGNPADLEEDELAAKALADEEAARLAAEEDARLAAIAAAEAERQRRLRMLPVRRVAEGKRTPRSDGGVVEGWDLSELTGLYALEAFNNVEDELAWVLVGVQDAGSSSSGDGAVGGAGATDAGASGSTGKKLSLIAKGSGGTKEIIPHLDPSQTLYGAFRVAAIDRRGTRLSIRPKLVTFTWLGSDVSARTKLTNSGALKAFSAYFAKPTIDMRINGDAGDLASDAVVAKLKTCVSATEYRFGAYDRDSQANEYIAQLAAMGITDEKAVEAAAAEAASAAAAE